SLLALLLGGACHPPAETFAPTNPNRPIVWQPGSWTPVWQDEFEGPAGAAPDPDKWSHELGGTGWGNKELQDYTDSTDNAALDGPATRFLDLPAGADADFHVYAVEWDPDGIVFLFDDVPYFQVRPADRPKWVYDHPFFIIVNLAVGGLFPGQPDETTMLP